MTVHKVILDDRPAYGFGRRRYGARCVTPGCGAYTHGWLSEQAAREALAGHESGIYPDKQKAPGAVTAGGQSQAAPTAVNEDTNHLEVEGADPMIAPNDPNEKPTSPETCPACEKRISEERDAVLRPSPSEPPVPMPWWATEVDAWWPDGTGLSRSVWRPVADGIDLTAWETIASPGSPVQCSNPVLTFNIANVAGSLEAISAWASTVAVEFADFSEALEKGAGR